MNACLIGKGYRLFLLLAFAVVFLGFVANQGMGLALPDGGTDVVGANTITAFAAASSKAVQVEQIAVTGQSFTRAWRISGLQVLSQPYDVQLSASNTVPIRKNDLLFLQFWARRLSSTARTEFVFELSAAPYDKTMTAGLRLNALWTLYSLPFRADRDYALGQGSARFRLGYNNQRFELGGVVLKNFAHTKKLEQLPFLGFSYDGREANASWRAAAEARIKQIRQADFRVRVVDANQKPVSGAKIQLEMTRHTFPFGSAVAAEQLLGTSSDSQKYKKTVLQIFNRVVLENDLKWTDWESYSRTRALQAIEYLTRNNIAVRGHNLVWACPDVNCLPADVPALLANPAALRTRIDSHFVDILAATKGKLVEWDVVNEPSANKRITSVLGEDEMALWYKRVKQLDPRAKLFINDYGNLGEGELDVEYKRIIKRLLALGAPLEGIGLQAHFALQLTPPEELHTRLEDFAKLGLPLAITEFDININNEALQADYTRDFLTVAFANPHVTSFLMWGFWAGRHWLPSAAMYRQDWSIKPNGQVFKDLVFDKWWTKANGQTNNNGQFGTRGFMGDYKITVTLGDKTVSRAVKLEKTSAEFVVKLP